MPLIKQDIIKNVAYDLWISEVKSRKIVDDFIEILKQTLQSGDDVLISGFGKFCVKDKASRKGRNPINGDSIILPRRRVVNFKYSPKLKDKIERTHYLASFGVDPQDIFELLDFANQITPPNWIIHEYAQFPEQKPGNLYIEVFPKNPDDWQKKDSAAYVKGPMTFQKISNITKAGSENAIKECLITNAYGPALFLFKCDELLISNCYVGFLL